MRRPTNDVERNLAKVGPALSSKIAGLLRDEGKTPDAARQSVSRLPPTICVLRGLSFPRGARFIYLQDQFGTARYWNALMEAISQSSPTYADAIAGLRNRDGVVRRVDFDVVSGSPVMQKGHLASGTVLERLVTVGLVTRTRVDGLGECLVLAGEGRIGTTGVSILRARLVTEAVLLDAIRGWVGRMNLASPGVTRIRDDEPAPLFSTFRFDLCGPSYLHPLTRREAKKRTPGFLVADVVTGQILDESGVAPFLKKCSSLSHLRRIRPFLPMIIADDFTPEALRACRASGVIATRPETLFGRDVAQALADLLQTLSNAAAIAAVHPERIESLFSRLGAIEGAAGNLRGALFELVVGHMVRSLEGGSIDIGVLVKDTVTGRSAEIDVRLIKERQVTIYECRGHQPSTLVGGPQVEEWLTKRVPTIYGAHRQERRFDGSSLGFEFWTCGRFDSAAIGLLEEAKRNTGKYTIGWKNGAAVRDYALKMKAPGIRKIVNEHYFAHPLEDLPEDG